jgi:hypothetical protein
MCNDSAHTILSCAKQIEALQWGWWMRFSYYTMSKFAPKLTETLPHFGLVNTYLPTFC